MAEVANTFGEWKKWEEVRKKMEGRKEEHSGQWNGRVKPVDFVVDRGVIAAEIQSSIVE